MAACGAHETDRKTDPVNTAAGGADTLVRAPAGDTTSRQVAANPDQLGDDSVFTDGSIPASWENAGFTDPVAFKQFLLRLRSWVANGQKDSVANVIGYPLSNPRIRDRHQFLNQYDTLFNEQVKTALQTQNLRQIFRRDQGAMLGHGELWFRQSGHRFLIVAINNQQ